MCSGRSTRPSFAASTSCGGTCRRSLAGRQAWQSGHALHRRGELRDLVSCIEAAVDAVLAFLRVDHGQVAITGCWANVNAPGAAHAMHAHPNNFLSGVYYVDVEEGSDTINFHDPRAQAAVIRPPVTELTAYNTDQVVVPVGVGTLIMFPAWLPHSVAANRSPSARISVSFNVMFTSFGETMGGPLWGGRKWAILDSLHSRESAMTTVAGILKAKPDQTVYRVAPGASVFDAVTSMAANNIGALIVMEGETIVGMITERDYARKVVLLGRASRDTPVRGIMTSPVMCVRPGQSSEECMALMTQNRLRHLPVLDGGALVGLISIGDLVKDIISEQRFTIEQLEHYIMGERG
jgi:uncharacterized protein (TIGR02466 family)